MRPTPCARAAEAARRALAACLVGAKLLAMPGSAPAQALDPSGLYVTESGVTRMRIAKCGTGYCGSIVSTGGSGIDAKNPDPALRGRKLAGVQILQATKPSGEGFSGTLYNPNDGKTYSGSLTPQDADHVIVSGCVLGLFCKRQTWTRTK